MDIQKIRERAVVLVEEMLVKGSAGNHFAPMQREVFDEGILAGGKRHGLACASYGPGGRIDHDVADLDRGAGLIGGASDERPETSQQFGKIERFYDVIISASIEAPDTIASLIASRQHEHWCFLSFTEPA